MDDRSLEPVHEALGRYKQAHAAHLQTMDDLFGDEREIVLTQDQVTAIQDCYQAEQDALAAYDDEVVRAGFPRPHRL
jgi:hypothetical protein